MLMESIKEIYFLEQKAILRTNFDNCELAASQSFQHLFTLDNSTYTFEVLLVKSPTFIKIPEKVSYSILRFCPECRSMVFCL